MLPSHGEKPNESHDYKPKKWLAKANQLLEDNEYEEALHLCDAILTKDELNAKVWDLKGEALNNLDRTDEALECFNKAININLEHISVSLEGESNENNTDLESEERQINGQVPYEIDDAPMEEQEYTDEIEDIGGTKGIEYIDEAAVESTLEDVDPTEVSLTSILKDGIPQEGPSDSKKIPEDL